MAIVGYCNLCLRLASTLELSEGVCVHCRIDAKQAAARLAGRACPACGFDIQDGLFQCVSCEIVASQTLRAEHERQSYYLALIEERDRLRIRSNYKNNTQRKQRLRKVNKQLKKLGVLP